MGRGDAIVKGANAVDATGTIGILLSNENGGAIGAVFGPASARGIPIISPGGAGEAGLVGRRGRPGVGSDHARLLDGRQGRLLRP